MWIKKIVTGIALTALVSSAMAQEGTSSPLSRYGIGQLHSKSLVQHIATGGAHIGTIDPFAYNPSNPATLGFLNPNIPIFGIDFYSNNVKTSTANSSVQNNLLGINNLYFGFPILKGWGMVFSLSQYSDVGYEFIGSSALESDPTITERKVVTGDGGVNTLTWSNGVKVLENDNNHLAIGLNTSLYFGHINNTSKLEYSDNRYALNYQENSEKVFSDVGFDLGIAYKRNLKGNNNINIGLKYDFNKDLSVTQKNEFYSYFYNSVGREQAVTPFLNEEGIKTSLLIPHQLGLGFNLELRPDSESSKKYRYQLMADIELQQWSEFEPTPSDSDLKSNQLNDALRLSVGAAITPVYSPNVIGVNYLELITYRAGAVYKTGYLSIENKPVDYYGITFGLGLPITASQSATEINISAEYGVNGDISNVGIQERLWGVYIGLKLTPNLKYDRWFLKRKYD